MSLEDRNSDSGLAARVVVVVAVAGIFVVDYGLGLRENFLSRSLGGVRSMPWPRHALPLRTSNRGMAYVMFWFLARL